MAKQLINIGVSANDGTGDQIRDAYDKINDNFNEIYAGIAPTLRPTVPASPKGVTGDIVGLVAYNGSNLYICTADYTDGVDNIWDRIPVAVSSTPWSA